MGQGGACRQLAGERLLGNLRDVVRDDAHAVGDHGWPEVTLEPGIEIEQRRTFRFEPLGGGRSVILFGLRRNRAAVHRTLGRP